MSNKRILEKLGAGKSFTVLVDPDKHDRESLSRIFSVPVSECIDFVLVGGSLVTGSTDETIRMLRDITGLPLILFPGNVLQISGLADGILFLSLISGRNPEFLIGNHVIAAPVLRNTELEIIPTGYILVENGRTTSVEYMSNTKPIPADKHDLVTATAMAGEMLGQKLIYLEAGSGARENVRAELIREVRSKIGVPLMVGGGICRGEQVRDAFAAGADIVVVGTAVEKDGKELWDLLETVREIKSGLS